MSGIYPEPQQRYRNPSRILKAHEPEKHKAKRDPGAQSSLSYWHKYLSY
jgi:hypothetical protein